MRRVTRSSCAVRYFVLSVIALGAPAAAAAASAEKEELERWLPSLALSFDVHHQSFDVTGDSDLRYRDTNKENVLTSVISFDGAVSTPALAAERFGSPRLFVQAGGQVPLSDENTILNTVRSFPPPIPPEGGGPPQPDPETIKNCPDLGGVLEKESCDQTLSSILTFNGTWSAGLGVEFTLPTPSRAMKIRTSLDYFGQSLDFDGEAKRDDRGANGQIVERFIIGGASTSKTLHAIGPRISFSGEVGRVGPLSLGVFAETRLYWLLNDDAIQYGTTNADGSASSFVANPDHFVAQGGAGLRITWVGSQ